MALKIKEEHKNTYVAFGKHNLPLGQRSDIYILARLGKERNAKMMQYFEDPESITDEDIDNAENEYFEHLERKKKSYARIDRSFNEREG